MCMDITETYDDMIGLRLLLYMCKAETPHLGDRVVIRGYKFNEQLQTYYKIDLRLAIDPPPPKG